VPFFKDFLSNHAEDWISSSKISDKEVHLEAVKIYMTLINSLAYVEPDPNPSDEWNLVIDDFIVSDKMN